MYKTLLTLLVLCQSTVLADVSAVIKAPDKANPGDLVILDSSASIGDNRLWVVDPRVEGRYLILDDRIVFAIGTPGTYTFQLIVADTTAAIAQVRHNVQIGALTSPIQPPPPTDPTNPPPTEPAPPETNRTVFKAVRAATDYVNDPETAKELQQALSSLSEKTPATVQAAIGDVLLKRKDQSKNWYDFWRVPVNAAIANSGLPYQEVVKQIIEGLDATTVQSSSYVILYVRDNCPPCEQWKSEVAPRLLALGWPIRIEKTTTLPSPSVEITTNGKTVTHQGFLSFDEFCVLVSKMRK
jgi:hypothetical protein